MTELNNTGLDATMFEICELSRKIIANELPFVNGEYDVKEKAAELGLQVHFNIMYDIFLTDTPDQAQSDAQLKNVKLTAMKFIKETLDAESVVANDEIVNSLDLTVTLKGGERVNMFFGDESFSIHKEGGDEEEIFIDELDMLDLYKKFYPTYYKDLQKILSVNSIEEIRIENCECEELTGKLDFEGIICFGDTLELPVATFMTLFKHPHTAETTAIEVLNLIESKLNK